MRQADFTRSKSFLITPAKPADRRQGSKLCLQEGLQRGISLSHQNLGMKPANSPEHSEIPSLGWAQGLCFCLFFLNYLTHGFVKIAFIEILP